MKRALFPPSTPDILSSFQVGFEKKFLFLLLSQGMSTKCVTEGSPKLSIVGRGTKELVWGEKSWTWPKSYNTPRFPYKALQLFPPLAVSLILNMPRSTRSSSRGASAVVWKSVSSSRAHPWNDFNTWTCGEKRWRPKFLKLARARAPGNKSNPVKLT